MWEYGSKLTTCSTRAARGKRETHAPASRMSLARIPARQCRQRKSSPSTSSRPHTSHTLGSAIPVNTSIIFITRKDKDFYGTGKVGEA